MALALATTAASCRSDTAAKSSTTKPPTALGSVLGQTPSPTPSALANPSSPQPSASPPDTTAALPSGQNVTCPAGGTTVKSAGDLSRALSAAGPGTVIQLADGAYGGEFTISQSGTAAQPIWLCGSRNAVLDGQHKAKYILHLDHVSYVRVVGFTVTGGQKGVMTDQTQHSIIAGLSVSDIGDEAIHLRDFSSDNLVTGNTVRDTGNRTAKFGEGIYIGSAHSNWDQFSEGKPDNSDRNSIIGNNIAGTTAENIDIKEGTTGGVVSGNTMSGDKIAGGSTSADSLIDIKGNGWTVTNNTIHGGDKVKDGIQEHVVSDGWGRLNVIRSNTLIVNGPGYGVYINKDDIGNIVGCDNKVQGAASGLSNIKCT